VEQIFANYGAATWQTQQKNCVLLA